MSRALTWCWHHKRMSGNKFSSLCYYANCVSTTLTDLITLKVSISFIATPYFFRLSESNTSRCSWFPLTYLHSQTYRIYCFLYPTGLSFYPVNRTCFTWTVLRDKWWFSDLSCFILPWVGVHAFLIGEWQLMLRFYSLYLKDKIEII
jgi:hypothetical protein